MKSPEWTIVPGGGIHRKTAGVGDGMVHTDEFHLKAARLHGVARLHADKLGLIVEPLLGELVFEDPHGEPCAEHRRLHRFQKIRNRSHVVLMSVGNENSPELRRIFFKIGKIGKHKIDPRHFLVREADAAVDHDHFVAVFDHGEILSDLPDPAQHHDPKRVAFFLFCHSSIGSFQIVCVFALRSPRGDERL